MALILVEVVRQTAVKASTVSSHFLNDFQTSRPENLIHVHIVDDFYMFIDGGAGRNLYSVWLSCRTSNVADLGLPNSSHLMSMLPFLAL